MQANGTDLRSRSTRLLLGALLASLLLLRYPGSLAHPQFWAEDGTLFFQEAFNRGFLASALEPSSGYLHTFPRIVAGLALLFPMELAPLVFNVAAFVVQLLPALYLLSPRMGHLIPSAPARVAAALLYISLPASYETHVNITNSQWFLALTVLCILVAQQTDSARIRALEVLVAAISALTGPFSVLFLPLLAPRLIGVLKRTSTVRAQTAAITVATCATLQLGCAAASARISAAAPTGALSLPEVAKIVSMHAFFNAVFGINVFSRFSHELPQLGYALGLLALAFLLIVAVRDRLWPLLMLFYLAASTIVLSFLFPLNDVRLWLKPQAGPRYYLFACLFVVFVVLHLAFASRPFRGVGRVLLAGLVLVGVPGDFFHPRQPDAHWADQAAAFRSLPAGARFFAPVLPVFHGGMLLHKDSPVRGPSPLARLRPLPATTPADFSVGRLERAGLAGAGNRQVLSVTGWALEGTAEPASGVFVLVDDRVFPAVSGLQFAAAGDGKPCAECGFSRLIPVDEIGPGAHRVSIAVASRDGTGYFLPSAPRFFATSQFFP